MQNVTSLFWVVEVCSVLSYIIILCCRIVLRCVIWFSHKGEAAAISLPSDSEAKPDLTLGEGLLTPTGECMNVMSARATKQTSEGRPVRSLPTLLGPPGVVQSSPIEQPQLQSSQESIRGTVGQGSAKRKTGSAKRKPGTKSFHRAPRQNVRRTSLISLLKSPVLQANLNQQNRNKL